MSLMSSVISINVGLRAGSSCQHLSMTDFNINPTFGMLVISFPISGRSP